LSRYCAFFIKTKFHQNIFSLDNIVSSFQKQVSIQRKYHFFYKKKFHQNIFFLDNILLSFQNKFQFKENITLIFFIRVYKKNMITIQHFECYCKEQFENVIKPDLENIIKLDLVGYS